MEKERVKQTINQSRPITSAGETTMSKTNMMKYDLMLYTSEINKITSQCPDELG